MNAKQKARYVAVREACADEQVRFNQALKAGAVVTIAPAQGGEYRVRYVREDWWYVCNNGTSYLSQVSFCGCNDGQWAELLRLAGVERNPLFA